MKCTLKDICYDCRWFKYNIIIVRSLHVFVFVFCFVDAWGLILLFYIVLKYIINNKTVFMLVFDCSKRYRKCKIND